jgi:hypothetical protein
MGTSTGRDLHIDTYLSEIAINYRPQGMIADMIAPIVSVSKETNVYPVFSRKEAFSIEDTSRSRATEAKRITRSVGSAAYAVKNYALAYDLPIEDRANMDAALQFELEAGAGRYLQDKLMLDWDRRVLSMIASATNVATGFLTGSAWNAPVDANQGDPISMIFRAKEQQQSLTAQSPNSILIGWRAWNLLRRNSKMRNFILGTNNGGGAVTRDAARAAFEVERFNVAGAFYDTSNEAQPAALTANPLHDAVLLYYAPTAPSRETPSFMYSFRWTSPELGTPLAVIRHPYDTRRRVEGIEVQYYQDERITGVDYGALILGVGSAQANGLT